MIAPLDNETVFKVAFTDKTVFTQFVKDIVGIEIDVDTIETEKKFEPKVGEIDISLDIFAESTDHRVIVEIQRIDYDYNFDRFLHYFMMAIAQMQRSSNEYAIDRTVYTIVVLTSPYRFDDKKGRPIRDEVLITSLNPRNLQDKVVDVYGHKMIFLNHHYRNADTPPNYRDWMDLLDQSIHHPKDYQVNLENQGIRRAVDLIDFEKFSGEELHQMKVDSGRRSVVAIERYFGVEEGKKQRTVEIAVNLKKKGIDTITIAESTGLSIKEIETL